LNPHSWQGILVTTLCDKVCQLLASGRLFSPGSGTSVSSTNKTDIQDMTEVLLKMVLNTLNQTHTIESLSTSGIEPSFKKDNHLSG
jgi:hypothetical protein